MAEHPWGEQFDAGAFAAAFQHFIDHFRQLVPQNSTALCALVETHLGSDPRVLPSLVEKLEESDHVNLQLALDDLGAGDWELIGLPAELRNHTVFSLVSLLRGRIFVGEPGPVEYANLHVSADATVPCVQLAVYLARFDEVPLAVLVATGRDHTGEPGLRVEVLGTDTDAARRFLAQVRDRMDELNVYRGKVLSFNVTRHGHYGIDFHRLPAVTRDDIVWPAADLDALDRHCMGISERAAALRHAGRHLRRGVLLFGPPGTGKTLSIMYLCNLMPERTTLLLSGVGAGALGQAAAIARSLQPSMIVLEDVDLIAMERTMPGRVSSPLLFQLLNEMDGLDVDADIIFVLTTNRAELLEPALAARPGRIDQIIEVRLPEAEQRRLLFELYLRGVEHRLDNLDSLVSATKGVSASFIKEVVRRAVVEASEPGDERPACLVDDHLNHALADLLTRSDPLTRSILGAGGLTPGA